MGTLSPAVADAFGLLHMNLYLHLDEAEFLAQKWQEWTEEDSETARKLIPDLVIVIRGLLTTRYGRTATAGSARRRGRARWWR